MRFEPHPKYHGHPCSYVGTGCAYEDVYGKPFDKPLPPGLKDDGYATLETENKYLRSIIPVRKKQYFRKGERPILKNFLLQNSERCCICVYGHFIYANEHDYWSYFNNDNDEIVCIWYLKEAGK